MRIQNNNENVIPNIQINKCDSPSVITIQGTIGLAIKREKGNKLYMLSQKMDTTNYFMKYGFHKKTVVKRDDYRFFQYRNIIRKIFFRVA